MRLKRADAFGLSSLIWLFATPALAVDLPRDFAALDRNGDEQVSFAEFSDYARTLKIGTTEAAQYFIRLSAGDPILTRDEFALAKERESVRRSQPLSPMSEAVSDVEAAGLTAMEPVEKEPIRADQVRYEKTPNEEVAGELIRNFEDQRWNDGFVRFAMRS